VSFTITDACTGCTACARQCPTAAIAGRPEVGHRIDPAACIECGVCGMVCPIAGAVLDANRRPAEHVPRPERPRPRVWVDACNGCGACVDRCPFGVLEVMGPRYSGWAVVRQPDACVSCGECERACSKGALLVDRPWSTGLSNQIESATIAAGVGHLDLEPIG
jgi:ferredoxin